MLGAIERVKEPAWLIAMMVAGFVVPIALPLVADSNALASKYGFWPALLMMAVPIVLLIGTLCWIGGRNNFEPFGEVSR